MTKRKVFLTLIILAGMALMLMAKADAAETKHHKPSAVKAAPVVPVAATPKPEEKKEEVPTPTLTAEEKLQIREFQLKDSRLLNEIQKRQAEIVQLQAAGQENIQSFNLYVKGVCKPVGEKRFDLDLSILSCSAPK